MSERTQETLVMETERCDLRSEVVGWTHEDSNLYVPGKMIGFTPAPIAYARYDTILEAQADGWKLIGPPVRSVDAYHWYLVR